MEASPKITVIKIIKVPVPKPVPEQIPIVQPVQIKIKVPDFCPFPPFQQQETSGTIPCPQVEEGETIDVFDNPKGNLWFFKCLYKFSHTGQIHVWQIGFDGKNLVTKHGIRGGVIQTVKREVELNTRSESLLSQALQEARQKYKEKTKEGYAITESKVTSNHKVMKGNEYETKRIKDFSKGVDTQPKLDGIRISIRMDNGNVLIKTFLNTVFTHLKDISDEAQEMLAFLPPGALLDGELFSPELSFNQITSAVKTVKTVSPLLKHIKFYLFDVYLPENLPFEFRYSTLMKVFYLRKWNFLELVPTNTIYSEQQLGEQHVKYLEAGFEGTMIKQRSQGASKNEQQYKSSLYIFRKGFNIMKLKNSKDEEAIVIGVEECKGTEKGTAKLIVRDPRGNLTSARMCMPAFARAEILNNPQSVIGKQATILYQELTEKGVYRFPRVKAIRDYE